MAAILKMWRRPKDNREPAPNWDNELHAMEQVGAWLNQVSTKEARFRILAYWMWREKSGDAPRVEDWVDSVAEQSAEDIGRQVGFKDVT